MDETPAAGGRRVARNGAPAARSRTPGRHSLGTLNIECQSNTPLPLTGDCPLAPDDSITGSAAQSPQIR